MNATNFHLRLNITLVPGIWIATITEINYRDELRSGRAILGLNETHMKRKWEWFCRVVSQDASCMCAHTGGSRIHQLNLANDLYKKSSIKEVSTPWMLSLLLSFIILVSESLVAEKTTDGNDVSSQVTTVFQAQPSAQEFIGEKKLLRKRSYDLLSLPYIRTYAPVLPWYRGGLSSYGLYGNGWYPSGWPLSYGGWHSDWYKGW
ncbi:hypothetical protein ALC53_04919 [Atta colombica]|uniref:Uncharacterized protein n=1 Tax=Atta colombica TaxID=520822 RepID=A0A195BJ55_9HYME|nr:hypothetical protein ALC53_04919 [Atta colombica]